MLSIDDALQLVLAGVVVLMGLCLTIVWIPARHQYPGGFPARTFATIGLVAVIWDPGGLGVLGGVLAGMGVAIWWSARPAPELPRPRRTGLAVAAAITGVLVLAMIHGWGPLGGIPDQMRAVATLFVGGVGVMGCLAIADRCRVTFRDALRRRFNSSPNDRLTSFS